MSKWSKMAVSVALVFSLVCAPLANCEAGPLRRLASAVGKTGKAIGKVVFFRAGCDSGEDYGRRAPIGRGCHGGACSLSQDASGFVPSEAGVFPTEGVIREPAYPVSVNVLSYPPMGAERVAWTSNEPAPPSALPLYLE